LWVCSPLERQNHIAPSIKNSRTSIGHEELGAGGSGGVGDLGPGLEGGNAADIAFDVVTLWQLYQYFSMVICPGSRRRLRFNPRCSKRTMLSRIISGLPHSKI